MAAPGGCAPNSEADRGHCPEAELGREGGQRRAGISPQVSPQVSPQQSPTGQTGSVRGHTPWTTQVAFRAPLSPNTLSTFLLQIPCWSPAFLLESPMPLYLTTYPRSFEPSCLSPACFPTLWFQMQSSAFGDLHSCLWAASSVNRAELSSSGKQET